MSYALVLVENAIDALLIVGGCTENPIEISADTMIGKIAIEEIEAAPAVEAILLTILHAILLGDPSSNLLLINTMNDLEDFRIFILKSFF